MKTNHKRATFGVATLVIAIGIIVGTFGLPQSQSSQKTAIEKKLVEVDVSSVHLNTINEWHEFSGYTEAINQVDVRPMISGTITAIHFTDGSIVKKGSRLFTLDSRPYSAIVERARADVEAAQANAIYTKEEAERAQRLLSADAFAKKTYDERKNAARTAQAQLTAAQAALRSAQVDLAYTEIVAPISGRVSRAELTVGNAVNNGTNATKLTTIVSVSPIYVAFNVNEDVYLQNLRKMNKTIPVEVALADEQGYPHKGYIYSLDNQLDQKSGTIRVRAKLDNANGALIPGLFAKIRIGSSDNIDAVLIDDKAIGTDQNKKFVFVVSKDHHVQYREINIGNLHDGKRIVLNGLKDGEDIIVNGIQHVQPNDKVQIKRLSSAKSDAPSL